VHCQRNADKLPPGLDIRSLASGSIGCVGTLGGAGDGPPRSFSLPVARFGCLSLLWILTGSLARALLVLSKTPLWSWAAVSKPWVRARPHMVLAAVQVSAARAVPARSGTVRLLRRPTYSLGSPARGMYCASTQACIRGSEGDRQASRRAGLQL